MEARTAVELGLGAPQGVVPVGQTVPVATSLDLWQWWHTLSPKKRQRLSADPYAPVPPDMWGEVTHNGVAVLGTYWTSMAEGPNGFRLPHEVAEFVEQRAIGRRG